MSNVLRPDVLIVSRHLSPFSNPIWPESGITYLWLHDIMSLDYERPLFGSMTQIDGIVVPSDYHLAQIQHVSKGIEDFEVESRRQGRDLIRVLRHGLPMDLIVQTAAGPSEPIEVNPRRLLYISRPERGLATAIRVVEKLNEGRADDDRFKFEVGGYEVPRSMMDDAGNALQREILSLAKNSPDVVLLGNMDRKTMYAKMRASLAMLYPTDFQEIACVAAMEAQACGLPVITTEDYALRETCAGQPFIPAFPEDGDKFIEEAAKRVLDLANDPEKRSAFSGIAEDRMRGEGYNWDVRAEEWERMFMDDFNDRLVENPVAIARSLYRDSDLVACKKMLQEIEDSGVEYISEAPRRKEGKALLAKVSKEIKFLESDESYSKHYLATGEEDPNGDGVKGRAQNFRFATITSILKDITAPDFDGSKIPEDFSLLDWGCATGGLSLLVRENFPKARITGHDLSATVLARARTLTKEEYKKAPEDPNLEFVPIMPAPCVNCKYDVIVVGEVLEHVRDVREFLCEKILPHLKEFGYLFITVPAGAWEAESFERDPRRFHVRRFRNLDIEDLMGQMSDEGYSECGYSGVGREGNPLGWLIVGFSWNGKKPEPFNYDRHILTQRPRESVSVCMITKDRPWELARTCENVKPWIDEFIIADTGSKRPEAIQIAKKYADIFIEGPNPMTEGFDVARNASIAQATGDWIFWIDDDEWLDVPQNFRKYIRGNSFAGYVMIQNHMSKDNAHAENDTPIRLFRRTSSAKFYGRIHEQPEYGFDDPIKPVATIEDCDILHTGYFNETVRRGRFVRNLPLLLQDKAKNPTRLLTDALLIRDHSQFGKFELQLGKHAAGIAHLKKACDIFREKFLAEGPAGKYHKHAFKYYQEALGTLGGAFCVALSLAASPRPLDRSRMLEYEVQTLLFETTDDAELYMKQIVSPMVKEASRRLHGEAIYHLRPGNG